MNPRARRAAGRMLGGLAPAGRRLHRHAGPSVVISEQLGFSGRGLGESISQDLGDAPVRLPAWLLAQRGMDPVTDQGMPEGEVVGRARANQNSGIHQPVELALELGRVERGGGGEMRVRQLLAQDRRQLSQIPGRAEALEARRQPVLEDRRQSLCYRLAGLHLHDPSDLLLEEERHAVGAGDDLPP